MNRPRLTFDDPALEREWWAWFAAERGRVLRGGVAVLLIGMVLFAPFDRAVYPELGLSSLWLRLVALGLMLAAVPAFFGQRSNETLATHGQEWLLYVFAVTYLGMGAIGWVIAPLVPDTRLYVTLLTNCLLLAGLYGATGLRVRYAAPLGVGMTVVFVAIAALRVEVLPPGFYLACAMFGGGFNLLGLVMSHGVEREGRRAFLRARELERESARSDALLLNVMPRAYADRLAAGEGACVDRVPDATVLFATVVGFEAATLGRAPLDTVDLLDRIVATFDALATEHGVERVKTIGATYMAVSTRDGHALAAVRLALAMRDAVREVARGEKLTLSLRAGVASGPLVVGVIGRTRYAFDCWGDTVNVAARLDTSGEPDRVQVSGAVADRVGELRVASRGRVSLKGKGDHDTFWVERP